jgi:hypothetical protein
VQTSPVIRGRQALVLVAALAWFGVLLQLYLSVRLALQNQGSSAAALVSFFSYLTVLTNIFVALTSTLPLTFGNSRLGRWFGTGMVLGSATTAIIFVGISYHVLLRNVWSPQGLQRVADLTLHYAVPVAALAYWIVFPPAPRLPGWAPLSWCIYPLIYTVYALGLGELVGSYPYYFIDAGSLGYPRVLMNLLGLLVVFLVLGGIVLGIARFRQALSAPTGALPPADSATLRSDKEDS